METPLRWFSTRASALVSGALILAAPSMGGAAEPFPADFPGLDIGTGLPAATEPSGLAWHPRLGRLLLCADNGRVVRMTRAGSEIAAWSFSGNWEGIAVVDPDGDLALVVNENTAVVREFNVASGTPGARTFDLTAATPDTGVMPLTVQDLDALRDQGDTTGVEALVFVPMDGVPQGGELWAGSQETGEIFRFRIPSSGSSMTYLGKYPKPAGVSNSLQGLEYDWQRGGVVYAVYGSSRILALGPAGAVLADWTAPANGGGKEGVATDGESFFIALDPAADHRVWRHDAFRPALGEFADGFEAP